MKDQKIKLRKPDGYDRIYLREFAEKEVIDQCRRYQDFIVKLPPLT